MEGYPTFGQIGSLHKKDLWIQELSAHTASSRRMTYSIFYCEWERWAANDLMASEQIAAIAAATTGAGVPNRVNRKGVRHAAQRTRR
jgi:hypothetical protein